MQLKKSHFLFLLLFLVSCSNKPIFDVNEANQRLDSLYRSMTNMDYCDMSLEEIDSLIDIYTYLHDSEQIAICHLLKGAKLYNQNNNVQAIRELKLADQHIDEKDKVQGRLYYYLSRILSIDNPQQSAYYAHLLADWSITNEDFQLNALANKLLMNLEEDIDSAYIYKNIAVSMFDLVGDTLMKEKSDARFAIKFIEQLPIDSVVALVTPFYNRVGYARDADALATIYLLNQRADEALPYIQKLASAKGFEFQYYNNMAVYYSQKSDFERSLEVYDSAFHIYQQHALQIIEEQIAFVNGEYDKKLYDQQIDLQYYRMMSIVVLSLFIILLSFILIVWLIKSTKRYRTSTIQLVEEKEKLEVVNEELVDTSKKQSQKLYAVSDICKQTYASIVLANPDIIKVISRSLYDNLNEIYPQLSNMDFTYMFLDFIGLKAKDICNILNVQEGTYYCRRSAIKKKLGTDVEQDIDEIFNQFFLGPTIKE